MNPTTNNLSSDRPEEDPANDVLGYAPFAENLAKAIVQMVPDSGIVMGIYAPWGAGKTTLLKFVQHFLEKYEEADQPVIVPFNPWWFSGQEDLANAFFQQLLSVLGKNKRVGQKVRDAVEKYADFIGNGVAALATLAGAAVSVPVPTSTVAAVVKGGVGTFSASKPSIHDVKADVETALKETDTKLLVVIDDIDRLTAEETRQLFRVIKAVADFPNVIYLLAFDNSIAAKALESVQVGDGNAYIEKIVQVPFDLPMPDDTSLLHMLAARLDVILNAGGDEGLREELFDNSHWADVYQDGIRHFIETPRDVVRLSNTLSVTYAGVRGEVNPVDFIAIETLRLFVPSVYNVIRNRPRMFTGTDESIKDYEKKEFIEFHTAWLEKVAQEMKQPVKNLLLSLFPKIREALGRNYVRSDDPAQWSRRRRIAHAEVFPTYFRLAPPNNELPNSTIHEMIRGISTPQDFAQGLIDLQKNVRPDGSSLARHFLARFQDYTNDLPEKLIPVVVQGLFDAGDTLLANEKENPHSIFDFGLRMDIGRIIRQLMLRLDEPRRFDILRDAMNQTKSYGIVADRISLFRQENGKDGGSGKYESTVTPEHLEELERITGAKIAQNINLDDFGGELRLNPLLYIWGAVSSKEEVGQWMKNMVATDDQLISFLSKMVSVHKLQSGDSPVELTYHLDPHWLLPYLELLEIEAVQQRLIMIISSSSLAEEQRRAVLQFLQEYEDREQGLNPQSNSYEAGTSVFERFPPVESNEPSNS